MRNSNKDAQRAERREIILNLLHTPMPVSEIKKETGFSNGSVYAEVNYLHETCEIYISSYGFGKVAMYKVGALPDAEIQGRDYRKCDDDTVDMLPVKRDAVAISPVPYRDLPREFFKQYNQGEKHA